MKTKQAFVAFCLLSCFFAACHQSSPVPSGSIPTRSALVYFTPVPTQPIVTEIPYKLVDERQIGQYTIKLWAQLSVTWYDENPYIGGYGHFTIEAHGQPTIRIDDANTFLEMPVTDLTGEGNPDILLGLTNGGSHCCEDTVLLDLGPEPVELLHIRSWSSAYGDWGTGEFVDLNGDGAFEFITYDAIPLECTPPAVKAVLQFQSGEGYRPAGPQFPQFYEDEIGRQTSYVVERYEELNGKLDHCSVLPLVSTYFYAGQPERARESFNQFYKADDAETFWLELVEAVENGRFYTP